MPDITDPMDGFVSLRAALKHGEVQMQPCEVHPEMEVLLDRPAGELRITYVLRDQSGELAAMANVLRDEPVEGVPCFGIGYAVAEHLRGKGLAQEVVAKALDELRSGMFRSGVRPFYIEAIVSISNAASNTVARKLLSETPQEGTDEYSGEPIFQYLKLFE